MYKVGDIILVQINEEGKTAPFLLSRSTIRNTYNGYCLKDIYEKSYPTTIKEELNKRNHKRITGLQAALDNGHCFPNTILYGYESLVEHEIKRKLNLKELKMIFYEYYYM